METASAWKVMPTVFWDSQGVLTAHFQTHGENMNSASYCGFLLKFREQFAENIQANWQEGYCSFITMPDPIQSLENSRNRMGNS
jgi:hypothetical protein